MPAVPSGPDRVVGFVTQRLPNDRGLGILEKQLDRVFEPYYRQESSRRRATGGTGLGLSIARNIARARTVLSAGKMKFSLLDGGRKPWFPWEPEQLGLLEKWCG